jgi:hypothetical protein
MNQSVIEQMQKRGWILESADRPGIYIRKSTEEEARGRPLADATKLLMQFKEHLAQGIEK